MDLNTDRRKPFWNGLQHKDNIMNNFVRVTKDNKTRDRGFIAIDAICAVFENQEDNNTQIMTMDGMWYDVVDGVERLYEACENANVEIVAKDKKSDFIKKRRMQSSALSEKSGLAHKAPKIVDQVGDGVNSEFKCNKRRYGISSSFSPGGEEWRCYHKPKDENNLTENVSKPDTADSRQSAKRVVRACGL